MKKYFFTALFLAVISMLNINYADETICNETKTQAITAQTIVTHEYERGSPISFSNKKIYITEGKEPTIEGEEQITLDDLRGLTIMTTELSSMEWLKYSSSINYLNLMQNKITEIAGLENIIKRQENEDEKKEDEEKFVLVNLLLDFNQISSMKGLKGLKRTRLISLSFNQISQIEGLESLEPKYLSKIDLSYNKITSLDGLEKLCWYKQKLEKYSTARLLLNENPIDWSNENNAKILFKLESNGVLIDIRKNQEAIDAVNRYKEKLAIPAENS